MCALLDQTVFVHFPKTAGTALAQLLIDTNTKRLAVAQWSEAERDLEPYELVHGHVHFDQVLRRAPDAARITMLRHPIERIVSLYAFHRRRPEDPMYETASRLSLHEFVEAGHGTQTYLSMLTDEVVNGALKPAEGSRPERLDRAISRLDTFDGVGITEYFDYSLIVLCRALGRPPIWRRSTANSAPTPTTRDNVEPDTIRLIRQKAALDIRLYEHALARFKQAVANVVDVAQVT